jgi:hypothetical protein
MAAFQRLLLRFHPNGLADVQRSQVARVLLAQRRLFEEAPVLCASPRHCEWECNKGRYGVGMKAWRSFASMKRDPAERVSLTNILRMHGQQSIAIYFLLEK